MLTGLLYNNWGFVDILLTGLFPVAMIAHDMGTKNDHFPGS